MQLHIFSFVECGHRMSKHVDGHKLVTGGITIRYTIEIQLLLKMKLKCCNDKISDRY